MTADPFPRPGAIFTCGTALAEKQIKNLQITQPNGPAILTFGVPAFLTADRHSGQRPAAPSLPMRTCVRGGTIRGPVSQGRWLVSLTQWTAANSWPCHWISLMQAEPRYRR